MHYFNRGSYGCPQSLGCVELPLIRRQEAWPYLTYGSLVTVARGSLTPSTQPDVADHLRPDGRRSGPAAGLRRGRRRAASIAWRHGASAKRSRACDRHCEGASRACRQASHHTRRKRARGGRRHDGRPGAGRPGAGQQADRRQGQRRAARSGLAAGRRRPGRAGRHRLARRPEHLAPLHRARPGAGGAGPVPAGQARHRPADRERLLLRLRRAAAVRPGRPEGHRAEDAPDRQAGPALQPPGRHRRRGARRAGERALQARADRPEGQRQRRGRAGRFRRVGRGRRRRADHLRQPRRRRPARADLEGPVPRPAPADHQEHPGFQADALRRRLLARQREEPAAAADLRHRLAVAGRAGRVPRSCWRRRRSATTASSAPSSTCSRSRPRSAAGCPSSIPRAASSARRWRTTRASGTSRPATSSSTPRTSPSRTCSRPPATCSGTRRGCTRPWRWRARSTTPSR